MLATVAFWVGRLQCVLALAGHGERDRDHPRHAAETRGAGLAHHDPAVLDHNGLVRRRARQVVACVHLHGVLSLGAGSGVLAGIPGGGGMYLVRSRLP